MSGKARGLIQNVPTLRFRVGEMSPAENTAGEANGNGGCVRIPSLPWNLRTIESLGGRWYKGQPFAKAEINDNGLRYCIHYGELFTKYGCVISCIFSRTNSRALVKSHAGDILFPASDVTPEGLGRCSVVLQSEVILGGDLICFRQDEVDSEFLGYAINNAGEQIIHFVTGTTVRHSSANKLKMVQVFIPLSRHEQQKIGSFFRSLDALIDGREKALGKLESLKKAMLEKMFPQGDAKIPEVRFKGFEGEWNLITMESLGGEWLKGQPFAKTEISANGLRYCIHYGELFTRYGCIVSSVFSRTNSIARIRSKVGDILFPASDVTPEGLGRCSVVLQADVLLGGDLICFRQDNVNSEFLGYAINNASVQIIRLVTGTTVRHSSANKLKMVKVFVPPTICEQKKIGTYFRSLDALLATRREEVEKLKQMKKAFLERMFV